MSLKKEKGRKEKERKKKKRRGKKKREEEIAQMTGILQYFPLPTP